MTRTRPTTRRTRSFLGRGVAALVLTLTSAHDRGGPMFSTADARARRRNWRRPLRLAVAAALVVPALGVLAAPASAIDTKSWVSSAKNTDDLGTRHSDWMKLIPGHVRLDQLTIPATHDSMSVHGGSTTQTQTLCGDVGTTGACDIRKQLDAGIRMLDIRHKCNEDDGKFKLDIYHGTADQHGELNEDVLKPLKAWLTEHPSETVLLDLSDDGTHHDHACNDVYKRLLHDTYLKPYADTGVLWRAGCRSIPTPSHCDGKREVMPPALAEVRGKIVLINHEVINDKKDESVFTDTLQNRNADGGTPYWNKIDEDYNDTDGHPPLYDVCEGMNGGGGWPGDKGCWSYNKKADLNQQGLSRALNNAKGFWAGKEMFYTSLVGAKSDPKRVAGGYDTGSTYIKGMNQRALEYMRGEVGAVAYDAGWGKKHLQFGIVSMDFPGAAIIDFLVHRSTEWYRGRYDVGVLKHGPCGTGSEQVEIRIDNEDDKNHTKTSGWIGDSVAGFNTLLRFCRVDGSRFGHPATGTYAMLKLSEECPPGSHWVTRYTDDEDEANENRHLGDILPSFQDRNSRLEFCAFRPHTPETAMKQFPALGFPYGVFGAGLPGALATGHIAMDDEDDDNNNGINTRGVKEASYDWVWPSYNTVWWFTKVRGVPSTTTVTLPAAISEGQSYVVEARVATAGATITHGSVLFSDTVSGHSTSWPVDGSGVARLTVDRPPAGPVTWTATFSGNAVAEPSTGTARGTVGAETSAPRTLEATPVAGRVYTASTLHDGCATYLKATMTFCGTVTDRPEDTGVTTGIDYTEFALRGAGGRWWNGSSFVADTATFVDRKVYRSAMGDYLSDVRYGHGLPDTALTGGAYLLKVRAVDPNGNSATNDTVFRVDADAPTVTVTGPLTRTDVGYGQVSYDSQCPTAGICGVAEDDNALAGVELAIEQTDASGTKLWWNGEAFTSTYRHVAATVTTSPSPSGVRADWHLPLPSSVLTDAAYDVVVIATDGVGLRGTDQEQFNVTTSFPTGEVTTAGSYGPANWDCSGHTATGELASGGVCGTSSKGDVRIALGTSTGLWWSAAEQAFVPGDEPTYNRATGPNWILPVPAAALGDGTYTVRGLVIGDGGNDTAITGSFTWDGAPDSFVTGGVRGLTNDHSPSFEFTSDDSGSTFECKLDGPGTTTGSYAGCTSPNGFSSLADGSYTFSMRATDAAGNTDPTPATETFTVDATPPDTTITSGPSGGTNNASPSFGFSSSESRSTFACKLDGPGTTTGSYAACTSPMGLSGLADGSYTFSVRATDAAGNTDATPATRSVTVDTTAPDTVIDTGPAEGATSLSREVSFDFGATEDGSTFACKLDSGSYAPCTSPTGYTGLALGAHTFTVRATDWVGNIDATPATRTWYVKAATSLLHNGQQLVTADSTLLLGAKLSSAESSCVSPRTVSFTLDRDPDGLGPASAALGRATTDSSGQATLAVSTAGWTLPEAYEVTAQFAGTDTCAASSDLSTVTVARPGEAARGGGWYTLDGSGRNDFSFAVGKVTNTSPEQFRGQVLFTNSGKWRVKGTLSSYAKSGSSGSSNGTGELYHWDATLNDGQGDWVLSRSDVPFAISYNDRDSGGREASTTPDQFGIIIGHSVNAPPEPASLPNSTPQDLGAGNIGVR